MSFKLLIKIRQLANKTFNDYLKTVAGSIPLILFKANEAPPKEIKLIVPNIVNSIKGETENIKPE